MSAALLESGVHRCKGAAESMGIAGVVFRFDVDVRSGALVAAGVISAIIYLAANAAKAISGFATVFIHFDHLATSICEGKGIIHVTFCHRRSASVLWDGQAHGHFWPLVGKLC